MNGYLILTLAVLIVFVYAALVRRFMTMARPMRCKLIELGEELLAERRLNERQRDMIALAMDRNLSGIDAWGIALMLLPAWALALFDFVRSAPGITDNLPSHARKKFDTFAGLHVLTTLMNSPAALLLVAIQSIPILLTSVSLVAIATKLTRIVSHVPHRASRSSLNHA